MPGVTLSVHPPGDYLVHRLPPNHRHVTLLEAAIGRFEVRRCVLYELTHDVVSLAR